MIELIVQCPFCKHPQHYISYMVKRREQVFNRRRVCVWCGTAFMIKSERHDNIRREVMFR